MRDSELTLGVLRDISTNNPEYRFKRLYENLYNIDFYIRAYLKLAPHEGNMTKGTDGRTIDGFGLELVESIIQRMKLERFNPKPGRLKYIEKKNGKLRPLGIGNFEDKLVQEVIREILEAIYEPVFKDSSHGFRPGRSCHTALRRIKMLGEGTSWVIEGDLTNFFGTIDHELLIQLLSKRIDDGRLLNLIRKFLKAGYMDGESFVESQLGTPQGSVLSPILANIYLHEFDEFMEEVVSRHERGERRGPNKEYDHWNHLAQYQRRLGNRDKSEEYYRKARQLPSSDLMDPNYCRVRYTRYADDFVIFISGSKAETLEIRDEVALFLEHELKLVLNKEKTKITNLSDDNARFLGYEIHRIHDDGKRDGRGRRSLNWHLTLRMPDDVLRDKIKTLCRNGKPIHRDELLDYSVEEIISLCNAEINGLYNYYSYASNVSGMLWKYRWYHIRSMQKTIAKKEKSRVSKVRRKYAIQVQRKDGAGMKCAFGISRGDKPPLLYCERSFSHTTFPNDLPEPPPKEFGTELRQRLLANTCEVCGSHERIEVHHIRNLSHTVQMHMEGRKRRVPDWVRLMASMNRKTLVLCNHCHKALHNGNLNISEEKLGSGLHGNRARSVPREVWGNLQSS
jgi:group II intron reverse transcriptase/maturase